MSSKACPPREAAFCSAYITREHGDWFQGDCIKSEFNRRGDFASVQLGRHLLVRHTGKLRENRPQLFQRARTDAALLDALLIADLGAL
jgi:hypothetical protein